MNLSGARAGETAAAAASIRPAVPVAPTKGASRATADNGHFEQALNEAERPDASAPGNDRLLESGPAIAAESPRAERDEEEQDQPHTPEIRTDDGGPRPDFALLDRAAAPRVNAAQSEQPRPIIPVQRAATIDEHALAARLDALGVRLSVVGLANPTSQTSGADAHAADSPTVPTAAESAPSTFDAANAATADGSSEGGSRSTGSDASGGNQDSDHPGERGERGLAVPNIDEFSTNPLLVSEGEAVAAVADPDAVAESGPVVMPDGITVRVADPQGAWEVDVLRAGSDLSLILRGASDITDSVVRDEQTLRQDLAREGWRLAHLHVEAPQKGNDTTQAVRSTAATESMSSQMQSNDSSARREEAPAWQPMRTQRSAAPVPTASTRSGRLDREI